MELAQRMRSRLAQGGGKRPSYAELAASAGVSVATLRHYFGTRDAAVAQVLALHGQLGEPHLDTLRRPSGPFAQSMHDACRYIALGLQQPLVAELHATGLTEGLGNGAIGVAYLRETLEPMILALEERLRAHVAAGDMRAADVRTAALAFLSPLLIAHLHQQWLGGAAFRPLDQAALAREHVEAFVRAYG